MNTTKILGLAALIPAIAMVFTDQAILPVALPTIQIDLKASVNELWWCINSYLLVCAVFLLLGGKIGDHLGYKRVFIYGMVLFTLASFLCGLSPSIWWLILARGLQGIGAAFMIPASSPLIMSLFPKNERGKAVGINVSLGSLFLIVAPLIGGYFTQNLSWRWVFWVNIPIGIAGMILSALYLKPSVKGNQKIDYRGFCYFALCTCSFIIIIMQMDQETFFSKIFWMFSGLFLISLLLLIIRERKTPHPLLELQLFKHPIYRAVNLSVFITQFVMMITVYRAVFFQDTMGWTPLKSGSIFFLSSIPVLIISPFGGWLADRKGPKLPIVIGFCLLIFSFLWVAYIFQDSLFWLVIGFLLFSFGIPLIFTPSYSSAMNSIPPEKAGVAFGILSTVRSISATLSVAIIASASKLLETRSFYAYTKDDPQLSQFKAEELKGFFSGVHPKNNPLLIKAFEFFKQAEIETFITIHLTMAFLLFIVFAFVFFIYHRKSSHNLPPTPSEGWG